MALSLSKNYPRAPVSGKIGTGGVVMEEWKKDARRDVVFVDIDALVPQDHLLRKIEKVMDYDWLYERLDLYEYDPIWIFLKAARHCASIAQRGGLSIIGLLSLRNLIPTIALKK